MSIHFNNADRTVGLKDKRKLKAFIQKLFEREGKNVAAIQYVFCSDEYLLNINKSFLNHDYYTDIITFDLSEPNTTEVLGEIYISIDRVKDNAQQLGYSVQTELLRVIFHGALHLCDYKDKTKNDIRLMRSKEDEYIALYQQ